MNFIIVFFLTTLPAGISTIFLIRNKKRIDAVLLKYDSNYISKPNTNNLWKIIKAYKGYSEISKGEKTLLLRSIISLLIGNITIITWLVLFFLFPDFVFGD